MYNFAFVVSISSAPFAAPRIVAVTPGVVSATARVGLVPVRLLFATLIVGTAIFARFAPNVRVIVPMPAVSVPAAATIPFVPTFGIASSAAWIFASNVVLLLLHVMGPLV
jgi:hypothetical protein